MQRGERVQMVIADNRDEKLKLLKYVVSNSVFGDDGLKVEYRKPFDLLAVANVAYQKEKALSGEEEGKRLIWLPGLDSNQQPSG